MRARDDWPTYMRAYRARHAGSRCRRCSRPAVLPGLRSCSLCLALDLERKPWLEGMRHDTLEHALWLERSRRPRSRCSVTGLTLARLSRGGLEGRTYSLQVDRISNDLGYVRGNLRLLTCKLNRAKQGFLEVPQSAVVDLLEDLGLRAQSVRAYMDEGGY